ncbi:hypothetical protein [Fibrella aquatilis]|uniref:Uncharacterized protein n=1 Tax=Fibrella aquatilis TaxID=2817059 RepID=A0A939GBA5_9BACT|nr:hypothetical protein [Fibrella aquatilis]MBO0933228.1 hypothetical protein [Fibrella aquatilis]
MERVTHLVDTYLKSRMAILRKLDDGALSVGDLALWLNSTPYKVLLRKRNPNSWRPTELEQLATALDQSSTTIRSLRYLADHLLQLPNPVLRQLLKKTQLNRVKLRDRDADADRWRQNELMLLDSALRCYKASAPLCIAAGSTTVASDLAAREPIVISIQLTA